MIQDSIATIADAGLGITIFCVVLLNLFNAIEGRTRMHRRIGTFLATTQYVQGILFWSLGLYWTMTAITANALIQTFIATRRAIPGTTILPARKHGQDLPPHDDSIHHLTGHSIMPGSGISTSTTCPRCQMEV